TQLSAAFRRVGSGAEALVAKLLKPYMQARGFDPAAASLLIAAYEGGSAAELRAKRRSCERIYRSFRAMGLGRSPGQSFAEGKFDFPYMRDFLMDHDVVCDTHETATTWYRLMPLYVALSETFRTVLSSTERPFWFGCHISHTYEAGAMLYFSFAFRGKRDR